jgi:predicted nucleic acid-binding protein
MTAALDTMTMIWGLQGIEPRGGNPRQKNLTEMQQRSVILLDMLDEKNETIIVPSVMVAELLVKVEIADQGNYLAELQKRFFIPLFDLPASALAASLWLRHKGLPKDEQITRTTLKSDVMIVATAKVAGASTFYSNDRKCRKLASLAGMEALDLPISHPNLFRDAEIKGTLNQDPT